MTDTRSVDGLPGVGPPPQICLLCATRRGHRFLERLTRLLPGCKPYVFSFREESWEPPFFDDIAALTAAHGGRLIEARKVDGGASASFWDETPLDLMLVVSWRYMVPPAVYARPARGSFVFHDSLLPAYRGFSPTVWAIINGERATGVSLFEMTESVDAGDLVDQAEVGIGPDETIAAVLDRTTDAYLTLLERNLHPLLRGTAPRRPQDHSRATYTCRRLPADNRIDWAAPADRVHNLVRAVTRPYPGAFTHLAGARLRVWGARRAEVPTRYVGFVPGRVAHVQPGVGSLVLTGDGGGIMVTEVQPDDGPAVCAANVLKSTGMTLA